MDLLSVFHSVLSPEVGAVASPISSDSHTNNRSDILMEIIDFDPLYILLNIIIMGMFI